MPFWLCLTQDIFAFFNIYLKDDFNFFFQSYGPTSVRQIPAALTAILQEQKVVGF